MIEEHELTEHQLTEADAGEPENGVATRQLTLKQLAFLAAYRECGCIKYACAASRCSRRVHYRAMQENSAYRDAFQDARDEATDMLEAEARRRAMEGLRQYKFTKDGAPILHPETGTPYFERVYSDRLLEILLRAERPEKFSKLVRNEVSGPDGGPLEHSLRQLALLDEQTCDQLCDALEQASAEECHSEPNHLEPEESHRQFTRQY